MSHITQTGRGQKSAQKVSRSICIAPYSYIACLHSLSRIVMQMNDFYAAFYISP